jgi:hypothetical protein
MVKKARGNGASPRHPSLYLCDHEATSYDLVQTHDAIAVANASRVRL